jgi:hypothetical protein
MPYAPEVLHLEVAGHEVVEGLSEVVVVDDAAEVVAAAGAAEAGAAVDRQVAEGDVAVRMTKAL